MFRRIFFVVTLLLFFGLSYGDLILIPMDNKQIDHLKPYGIVYNTLANGIEVYWFLNYRGGSFVVPLNRFTEELLMKDNIVYHIITSDEWANLSSLTNTENMNIIRLTKAPRIGLYRLKIELPYDDAVEIALKYANIPFVELTDKDILEGKLEEYQIDWLHFDHEDFTGQFGKFFASYGSSQWYIRMVSYLEDMARSKGFSSVREMKSMVAIKIREYVENGGFLFGMCAGTDTLDIALAAVNTDIVPEVFDNTPIDPLYSSKLDFNNTFAFKNFSIVTDPYIYEYSDIDYPNYSISYNHPTHFYLKEFSAKYDPVSTMLVQNHTTKVKEFLGQTTAFNKEKIKENVTILADYGDKLLGYAKYIRGEVGKGAFCFLGGHDPEDYSHYVGDPPTDVSLMPNSPGYRLILNNVLFPASEKKKRKT